MSTRHEPIEVRKITLQLDDGTTVPVFYTGSGPVVLYVHGWSHSSSRWRRFQTTSTARCTHVAIDLPGFGVLNDSPASHPYLASYSEYLRRASEAVCRHFDQPLEAIVAHSLGACVAAISWQSAAADLRIPRKVILVDAPLGGVLILKSLLLIYPLVYLWFAMRFLPPRWLGHLGVRITGRLTVNEWAAMDCEFVEDCMTPTSSTLVRTMFALAFARVPSNVQVRSAKGIWLARGRTDWLMTSSTLMKYSAAWCARKHEFATATHTPFMEAPEEFNAWLDAILNELPNGKSTSEPVQDAQHNVTPTRHAINDAASSAKQRFGERLLILATIPTILAGSCYAYLESASRGYTTELIFALLLCTATAFLSLAFILIKRTLYGSASLLYAASEENMLASGFPPEQRLSHVHTYLRAWQSGAATPETLLKIVFHRPSMVLSGIVYGAILASAPIVLRARSDTPDLQRMLMLFMFFANSVTGAALYSTVTYLRQSWHLAKQLRVSFFRRRTPSARRYSRLLAIISVTGAVYIGMCQASIVFSHFAGAWVYGYAVFAVAVFISVYFVPQFPIRQRFVEERDAVLRNIEETRQGLFSGALTPEATEQIAKLYDAERQILDTGLGLSPRNASIVTWSAIGAAVIPFAATLFGVLVQKYLEMF